MPAVGAVKYNGFCKMDGRLQMNPQAILSLAHNGCNIKEGAAEHSLVATQQHIVQIHLASVANAVKGQAHRLAAALIYKRSLIRPFPTAEGHCHSVVQSHVRILQYTVCRAGRMHAARHSRPGCGRSPRSRDRPPQPAPKVKKAAMCRINPACTPGWTCSGSSAPALRRSAAASTKSISSFRISGSLSH